MSRLPRPARFAAGACRRVQQTRVAAFLISAHGALARQFAIRPAPADQGRLANRIERAVLPRIGDRLAAATHDVLGPGLALRYMAHHGRRLGSRSRSERSTSSLASTIDLAALGHAVHGAIRPAALLPVEAGGRPLRDGVAPYRVRKRPADPGADPVPEGALISCRSATPSARPSRSVIARSASSGHEMLAGHRHRRETRKRCRGLDADQGQRTKPGGNIVPLPPRLRDRAGVPIMKAVSVEEAVAMIPNGASVMVGGFMGVVRRSACSTNWCGRRRRPHR